MKPIKEDPKSQISTFLDSLEGGTDKAHAALSETKQRLNMADIVIENIAKNGIKLSDLDKQKLWGLVVKIYSDFPELLQNNKNIERTKSLLDNTLQDQPANQTTPRTRGGR